MLQWTEEAVLLLRQAGNCVIDKQQWKTLVLEAHRLQAMGEDKRLRLKEVVEEEEEEEEDYLS